MLLSAFSFFPGNGTMDDSMRSIGLDMKTLFHLYMVMSFLSLVVHFLQLMLTFMNLFIRLVSFLLSIIVGLFMLQVNLLVFFVTLPVKTIVWLNEFLGTKILLSLILTGTAYVYFTQDIKSWHLSPDDWLPESGGKEQRFSPGRKSEL
jgi:hypothetical protein